MPAILLDTSAYSAFKRGHPEVERELQEADDIVLTPVCLGEVAAGFLRGSRPRENREELEAFLHSPRVRVVSVDAETSERYAVISVGLREAGTPIPTNDLWICASAMQHGLRIVTTDAHFALVPQVMATLYRAGG